MNPTRLALRITITEYVDDGFPGWVACEFVDADGRVHRLVEKVPVVTDQVLLPTSVYPQPGALLCERIGEEPERSGRKVARITSDRPCAIETDEGLSEFVVWESELGWV